MSNFKNIMAAHKEAQEQPTEEVPPPSPTPANSPTESAKKVKAKSPAIPAKEPKRLGRPSGKRSNPEFAQVTAYIRKDTHIAVQMTLLKKGKTVEFSELVEDLLRKWVTSNT